jgi:beta-glucosidase-like glycosyl hydrolase
MCDISVRRSRYNSGGLEDGMAFPYCWAPNINLVRDGRWGRAGETSGEDVLITQKYMVAWANGLQQTESDGPLQALATW